MSQGRGSGAQRVLNQYAVEVRAYLSRHARKWLIIVIDADNFSVHDRLTQLAQNLRESQDERVRNCRADSEQIARLLPKWSIETWILFLNGETVDELTRYKNLNRDWDQLTTPAAAQLNESTAQVNPPNDWIPSLVHGFSELRRLKIEN
jgi:hypothetical protein